MPFSHWMIAIWLLIVTVDDAIDICRSGNTHHLAYLGLTLSWLLKC